MKNSIFINIAQEIGRSSKCISRSVGAVIEKEGRILSTGYNGTPAGYKNCNEVWSVKPVNHSEWSKKYEVHAEMNAIIWAARRGISIDGSTIFVTLEPCHDCTKNIIAAGIKKIVFLNEYNHVNSEEANKFLKDCGVEKIKYVEEKI